MCLRLLKDIDSRQGATAHAIVWGKLSNAAVELEYPTLMNSVTLKAHYDGEHIVLDEPFEIPVNAPLVVTVLVPAASEHDLERESWAALSARSLTRAYGDDEPEYTVADLKS